jgi:hypothetical protein
MLNQALADLKSRSERPVGDVRSRDVTPIRISFSSLREGRPYEYLVRFAHSVAPRPWSPAL